MIISEKEFELNYDEVEETNIVTTFMKNFRARGGRI